MTPEQRIFSDLLGNADAVLMAGQSVLNHHIDGIDYLCASRTPQVTAKIYMIGHKGPVDNFNAGFVAVPHTHRYDFYTVVLAGKIEHIRFKKTDRKGIRRWSEHGFDPSESGTQKILERCHENISFDTTIEEYSRGESYHVNSNEIHTLRIPDGYKHSPVILGILQFERHRNCSSVFLPSYWYLDDLKFSDSKVPSARDYALLRSKALKMMEGRD